MIETPRDLLYFALFATVLPACVIPYFTGEMWPIYTWVIVCIYMIVTERKGKK